MTKASRGGEEQRESTSEGMVAVFCMHDERPRKKSTFRGVFRASGNSLSSSRSQRCINCCTIGFSGLTIWNPEMLAPPAKTLSKLTLEKPWGETQEGGEDSCYLFFFDFIHYFIFCNITRGEAPRNISSYSGSVQGVFYYEPRAVWESNTCLPLHWSKMFPFTLRCNLNSLTDKQPASRYFRVCVRSCRRLNILLEPAGLLSFRSLCHVRKKKKKPN